MKFHIIQPVVVNQNSRSPACASRCNHAFFRCSSRIPPWPWTIGLGSPVVPDEYRTHSGWSNGSCANSSSVSGAEESVLPARPVQVSQAHDPRQRRDLGGDPVDRIPAIEVLTAVAIAIHSQQHLGLDLREAVDHAPHTELGRGRRPHRPDRGAREQRGHGLGDVRHVRGDPVAFAHAGCAQPRGDRRRQRPQLAPGHRRQLSRFRGVLDRERTGVLAGEHVLGVADPRAREPFRAGHRRTAEDPVAPLGEANLEELDQRLPERLDVEHRPAPQVVIALEPQVVLLVEPRLVARQRRALDPFR